MNRRGFIRGLIAGGAIIPTVSTRTIVDMAANTWRQPRLTGIYKYGSPRVYQVDRRITIWEESSSAVDWPADPRWVSDGRKILPIEGILKIDEIRREYG